MNKQETPPRDYDDLRSGYRTFVRIHTKQNSPENLTGLLECVTPVTYANSGGNFWRILIRNGELACILVDSKV